jgi:SAM-dependent methyltransferase
MSTAKELRYRLGHAFLLMLSQVFFTLALIPLFLWPRFSAARLVRTAVIRFFGRSLVSRYQSVIDFYGAEAYGLPLAAALERAAALSPLPVRYALDCGTGTRFAACRIAQRHPQATVLASDALLAMLRSPPSGAAAVDATLRMVVAESLFLPLGDASIDLAIAHNTAPFLDEMARVCRPGGSIIFVDSAACWMSPIARFAARRHGVFDAVEARRAGYGFYLLARRATGPK